MVFQKRQKCNDKHLIVCGVITGHITFRVNEHRNLSLAIPYYIVTVFRVVKLYLPLGWRATIVGGKQYFFLTKRFYRLSFFHRTTT